MHILVIPVDMTKKKQRDSEWDRLPDFLDTSLEEVSDDEILRYLAQILADIYLTQHEEAQKDQDHPPLL